MGAIETIDACRVCGSKEIVQVLNLGNQPLANSLKESAGAPEKAYPLSIAFCEKCSLVQLEETMDKEALFSHYVWVTGTSETARNYAETFCRRAVAVSGIPEGGFVIEIASNDGTFLKPFIQRGYRVLGVDPARNIADEANRDGVKTIANFWNRDLSEGIKSEFGAASVVFARNVIPHVSDLHSVIDGIAESLSDDGVGIIEFHYAGKILDELHYDSIYHEHLCYFSVASLKYLLNLYGLKPFHIDISPISGGSYVIYFSKRQRELTAEFEKAEKEETRTGINSLSSWKDFAAKSIKHRDESLAAVAKFGNESIIGFGSSARSSTYLNFCGFSSSDLKLIIDNNKLKQGMFSAGSSIPITSFDEGMSETPDCIFILAWNFRDEIIKQCREYGYSGPFLVPFPGKPYVIKGSTK